MYGVVRKICHEGLWSASRGLPSDAEQWSRVTDFLSTPYTHDRYFFLHTFWITTFDFQRRTCYEITLFPLKGFYFNLKKSTLPVTAILFFTFTSNLHKVTSIFDVTAVKTNVTWRRRYVTSYTTNTLIAILCNHQPKFGTHGHGFWWNFLGFCVVTQNQIIDTQFLRLHARCHGNSLQRFFPKNDKKINEKLHFLNFYTA